MCLQGGVVAEVVQDGAGFDGGELVGVAEEDEAGVRGGGGKEGGGEFEREHGGFVDDDVVVGQVARGVVLGNAVRADAEQAVQGAGAAGSAADGFLRGVGKMGGRARQAFFHAVRRFAGRRGKGDAACGVFVQFGRDEVGKGVGFAGAGAAVDEGEAASPGEGDGVLLFRAQVGVGGGCCCVGVLSVCGKARVDGCSEAGFVLVVAVVPKAVTMQHQRRGAAAVADEAMLSEGCKDGGGDGGRGFFCAAIC